ncbi:uncharacterized protein ACRADG_010673 [Cochliomyia hominivorax]
MMKICEKCRYTVAIILGVIGFLLSVLYLIGICINFGRKEGGLKRDIKLIVITAISTIISGLFVIGVIRKKYKLMNPWLWFIGGCIFAMCKVIVLHIIDKVKGRVDDTEFTIQLVVFILVLAAVIAIFWFSYSMYKEMRHFAKHTLSSTTDEQLNNVQYTTIPTGNTPVTTVISNN